MRSIRIRKGFRVLVSMPMSAVRGARQPLVSVYRMPAIRIGSSMRMRIRTEGAAARVTAASRIGGDGKHNHESGRK
jgi:hypothetical protein